METIENDHTLILLDEEEERGDFPPLLWMCGIVFIIVVLVIAAGLYLFLNWLNLGQYYSALVLLKFALPLLFLAGVFCWLWLKRERIEEEEETEENEED